MVTCILYTFLIDLKLQGIPSFCDFTIRDPHYFLILFWATIHDFEEKSPKKYFVFLEFFFSENLFGFFFLNSYL